MIDVLPTSLAAPPAPWRRAEAASAQALPFTSDAIRQRVLAVLLGGVVFVSMFNGLVKQAFDWAQAVYIVLDLTWVAFLIAWLIWPRPALRRSDGGISLLLGIILVYSIVQIANPLLESPFMAIGALRNRLLPILFFWVGKDLLSPRRARGMLLFLFAIGAVGAVLGILQWKIGLVGVSRWGHGFVPRTSLAWRTAEGESVLRPLSIYQDGGIAALFGGAVLFSMAMVYAGRFGNITTWLVRVSGVACLAFVAVSGVRAAVLCAIQGMLAAGVLSRSRLLPLTLVLVMGGGVLVAIGAAEKLAERYETIIDPVEAYSKNRGNSAEGILERLVHSPLGYGTGSAAPAADFYARTFGGIDKPTLLHSDNGYGNLSAEGGIPLVGLYIALLGCIGWQAWRRRSVPGPARSIAHAVFVFTAILAMWSATALPIDWQPTNIVFWLLVGSLFANAAPHPRRNLRR